MKLTYICTNFNNSQDTISAIKSLAFNQKHELNFIIVDNNSHAQDLEILKRYIRNNTRIHLIESLENLGYFKGLNAGLSFFKKNIIESDAVVIGNNDLIFPENFCNTLELKLIDLIEHPIVSPNIVTLDGEHQNPHVIRETSFIREIFYSLYHASFVLSKIILFLAKISRNFSKRSDMNYWAESGFIYQGHGSCYILMPLFFDLFSELYSPVFLMHEEFFLSKQLNDSNYKIYYSSDISVIHSCHGSFKNMPSKFRWKQSKIAHKEYRKYINPFKRSL